MDIFYTFTALVILILELTTCYDFSKINIQAGTKNASLFKSSQQIPMSFFTTGPRLFRITRAAVASM